MQVAWNPYGALGALALVLTCTLAAIVYFTAPHRPQNRLLALLLALEGVAVGIGEGAMYLLVAPGDALGAQAVVIVALLALPFVYLLFLATLETPLVAPLRTRVTRVALSAAAAGTPLVYFLNRGVFMRGVVPGGIVPWNCDCGPGFRLALMAYGLVALFALAPTLHAWHRARAGSASRAQARAYAIAFSVRDGLLAFMLLVFVPVTARVPAHLESAVSLVTRVMAPSVLIVFVGLLAYGILKTQLFDIDVRIKRGVGRSTIAALLAGAFFIGSEIVEEVVPVDGLLLGTATAGVVALALRPLRRGVDALLDRVVPGVSEDDAAYLDARKSVVYRAAVESAFESGGVSDRERAILDRLRGKLAIEPEVARRLEREVEAALSPSADAPAPPTR